MKKNPFAFTLVEVVLALTILTLIAGALFMLNGRSITDAYLDTKAQEIVSTLRLAQTRSATRFQNSAWGVHLDAVPENDAFVLFKGTSFAGRDISFDIRSELPSQLSFANISLAGGSVDIVFSALTGGTVQSGSFEIADSNGNKKTLTINSLGSLEIN